MSDITPTDQQERTEREVPLTGMKLQVRLENSSFIAPARATYPYAEAQPVAGAFCIGIPNGKMQYSPHMEARARHKPPSEQRGG
jgi:hypothetical protein